MIKGIFFLSGTFFIVHGILEAAGYFWRDWIIEISLPIWSSLLLIITGIALFIYPILKGKSKKKAYKDIVLLFCFFGFIFRVLVHDRKVAC